MKNQSFLVLGALIALQACQPVVASRGNICDPDVLGQIKPGETTREEVASKLGTPTVISTFDEKTWYYVGRETQQYSFLTPEVVKQQAVEVDFDDRGVVTAVNNLDLSNAGEATYVERQTPTYGQQNTLLRELLGDFSHPRPDMKNQRGSGT